MLKKFLHFVMGCRPGKFLGRGYGVFDGKKNRPPLVTNHEYDFYDCADTTICDRQVVRMV